MLFGINNSSFSQQTKIDSLLSILKTTNDDTIKVNILNTLSKELTGMGDYEMAIQYLNDALSLSRNLNYKKGIADYYHNIGIIYDYQGNYDKALENYFAALKTREETRDKQGIAASINNIGIIYMNQGKYDQALENYFASLKIRKEIRDKQGIAGSYNNIGLIYFNQGNYGKALENYFASLKIREEIRDKPGIAFSYNNIGNIYFKQGNYDKALENHFTSLKIKKEIGDKQGIAYSYNNIGGVYFKQGNYNKALENYFASLKIREEISDKYGIATSYNNIGLIYTEQGKYDMALEKHNVSLKIKEEIGDKKGIATSYNNISDIYFNQNKTVETKKLSLMGLRIAESIGSKDDIKKAYQMLSLCDSATGNWKSAYEYHKLYSFYKDSIFNEESSKQMAEMQTRYETEKKEKEIALQKAEIVKKEAVIKQQNIQRIAFASGFGLMFALAFVVFRAYRNKQKANKIISAQKAEVELQKSVIEEKNKNITDSIEYASYIQQAMLPTDDEFYRLLPEAFILYKPRDIVSGDFYWVSPTPGPSPLGEGSNTHSPLMGEAGGGLLLCTADCTGHGVPGAFMSMLCTALLNEAVNDKCIEKPNEIFEEVRNGIIAALKQRGQVGGSKDGMDGTIISIEHRHVGTLHATSLHSACANNPIYIVSNGSLTEIPPDRFPVGVYEGQQKPFTLHAIEAKKGDMIYTITDGFEDQLGGEKGKKFKSVKLKELLLGIALKPVSEQKEILEKAFEEWKGSGEQTDDVTVIGIRI